MKTRILPLALLGAALSGCIQENYASLEFYGVCAGPTPDTTTGACVYSASCDLYALFTYWYDPAVVSELLVPIEMFNQLPNNADLSAGRVNTNDAIIEEWRFEYLVGDLVAMEATAAENMVVPAASHKTALVPVFPASLNGIMSALPANWQFTVNVRAAGRYNDERSFETGPFKVAAGKRSYSAPLSCVAPKFLAACPQIGQEGSYACAGQ